MRSTASNGTRNLAGIDERLEDTLRDLRVGARLLITGPPTDVHLARAAAARLGVLEEEMTLLPTDDGAHRRVFCAHCHSLTVAEGLTNNPADDCTDEIDCGSCGTTLTVSTHFSHRMAAYLGYSAHAEEAGRHEAREAA